MSPNLRTMAVAGFIGLATTATHADIFTNYNLLVRGDLISTSQVAGRTAVGGNLTGSSSNYGTGLTPALSYRSTDVLSVGGSIGVQNINMQAGNVRYGGTRTGNINHNGGGTTIRDTGTASLIAQMGAHTEAASLVLSQRLANSFVNLPSNQPAGVTLNAQPGADGVAVFTIPASSLFSNNLIQQLDIAMNGASSVVINISGSSVNWTNGNMVGSLTGAEARSRVVWNFYEAMAINFGGRSMNGAVLAPDASVSMQGTSYGAMWVGSLNQQAMVSGPAYVGVIPTAGSASVLLAAAAMSGRRRRSISTVR